MYLGSKYYKDAFPVMPLGQQNQNLNLNYCALTFSVFRSPWFPNVKLAIICLVSSGTTIVPFFRPSRHSSAPKDLPSFSTLITLYLINFTLSPLFYSIKHQEHRLFATFITYALGFNRFIESRAFAVRRKF